MRLESGPASGDRNYALVVTIISLGLGGYFFYDWGLGYPAKNHKEAVIWLTTQSKNWDLDLDVESTAAKLPEAPLRAHFKQLVESAVKTPEEVYAVVGKPLHTTRDPASGNEFEYFAGQYGNMTVQIRSGQVLPKQITWHEWYKSKDDIQLQFYCGLVCLAVALLFLWKLYRAATLRVVIDDDGMTYGGQQIPWSAMTALKDYSPKGWIDLYHTARGAERKLRLDNQKVGKFDEIVNAICDKKQFTNLVAEHREKLAREAEADDDVATDEPTRDDTP